MIDDPRWWLLAAGAGFWLALLSFALSRAVLFAARWTRRRRGSSPPLITSFPDNTGGDRMNRSTVDLQARVAEISAAWEVWGEAQHEIRRHVRTAEWSGDTQDAAQRAALQAQFNAQIFETYARARLQCAIVGAVDGVDQVDEYDRHWSETWGVVTATKAAAAYVDAYAAALERQRAARVAAAEQAAALEEAGVPPEDPPPAQAAPTPPPPPPPPARKWWQWPSRRAENEPARSQAIALAGKRP